MDLMLKWFTAFLIKMAPLLVAIVAAYLWDHGPADFKAIIILVLVYSMGMVAQAFWDVDQKFRRIEKQLYDMKEQ